MNIQTKRIYDEVAKSDGFRVLVDRVWPRGVKKEDAKIDLWEKDIAPTSELRKWFGHDSKKWGEFKKKYKKELRRNLRWETFKKENKEKQTMTLLYSAKDTEHNQAIVLKELLEA